VRPRITIRHVASGVERTHGECFDVDDDPVSIRDYVWSWTAGNFGCDCNRALCFARSGGEEDPDMECSTGLYLVQLVDPRTGGVLLDELARVEK